MIQEYLFINGEKRTEIEAYKPEKVSVEFYDIENSECWIATYFVPGEKEESANLLSKVNQYIINSFHPIVLTNGCAAYFNKMLFPHINEFERKLRKLLYLKSALHKGDKATENIKDLENKDFGDIFKLLFTDEQFVKNVRTSVNEKTWQFTKQEILAKIEQFAEDTVWDQIIGIEAVPTLRQRFITVKNYRNDVMHAHNVEASVYREAKKLFEQINKQLNTEIGKIIDIAENNPAEADHSDYNLNLSSALERQASQVNGYIDTPVLAALRNSSLGSTISGLSFVPSVPLSEIYGSNLAASSILSQHEDILSDFQASKIDMPVLSQVQGLTSEIQSITAELQGLKADMPALLQYQEIASKIDIPAVTQALKFQNELQSIVGNNANELLTAAKIAAEASPICPEIQQQIQAQHFDLPDLNNSLMEED